MFRVSILHAQVLAHGLNNVGGLQSQCNSHSAISLGSQTQLWRNNSHLLLSFSSYKHLHIYSIMLKPSPSLHQLYAESIQFEVTIKVLCNHGLAAIVSSLLSYNTSALHLLISLRCFSYIFSSPTLFMVSISYLKLLWLCVYARVLNYFLFFVFYV